MGESLMQQRRVKEEGFRVVNFCPKGRIMTVPLKKAPANYVPAAAVIRRWQALSGMIGRKGRAGGCVSLSRKCGAKPRERMETGQLRVSERKAEFLV